MNSPSIYTSQTDERHVIERRQFKYSVHIPERRIAPRQGETTEEQGQAETYHWASRWYAST